MNRRDDAACSVIRIFNLILHNLYLVFVHLVSCTSTFSITISHVLLSLCYSLGIWHVKLQIAPEKKHG